MYSDLLNIHKYLQPAVQFVQLQQRKWRQKWNGAAGGGWEAEQNGRSGECSQQHTSDAEIQHQEDHQEEITDKFDKIVEQIALFWGLVGEELEELEDTSKQIFAF